MLILFLLAIQLVSSAFTGNNNFHQILNYTNINLLCLSSTHGFIISGPQKNGFGDTVSPAGDINDDGFDDILISVTNMPLVYVIYGKKGNFSSTDVANYNGFKIIGEDLDLTYNPSKAGDFNGDGISDIIIGAPEGKSPAKIGECYIIYGKKGDFNDIYLSNLSISQGFKVIGISGDQLGYTVDGAGDINADGFDDIIINSRAVTLSTGYIIFGKNDINENIFIRNMTTSEGIRIYGPNIIESVSGIGDINADSIDDVIINLIDTMSYVLYGTKENLTDIAIATMTPSQGFLVNGNGPLNARTSSAGDINFDGINDFVLGYPPFNTPITNSFNPGVTYIIYGKRGLFTEIDFDKNFNLNDGVLIVGEEPEFLSVGRSIIVKGTGDINGDTIDDLIIGSNFDQAEGRSYIIFGKPTSFTSNIYLHNLTLDIGFKIFGGTNSVDGAGDIDNNGVNDIIIGVPSQSKVYLVYNGSEIETPCSNRPPDTSADEKVIIEIILGVIGGVAVLGISGYCYYQHKKETDYSEIK